MTVSALELSGWHGPADAMNVESWSLMSLLISTIYSAFDLFIVAGALSDKVSV